MDLTRAAAYMYRRTGKIMRHTFAELSAELRSLVSVESLRAAAYTVRLDQMTASGELPPGGHNAVRDRVVRLAAVAAVWDRLVPHEAAIRALIGLPPNPALDQGTKPVTSS